MCNTSHRREAYLENVHGVLPRPLSVKIHVLVASLHPPLFQLPDSLFEREDALAFSALVNSRKRKFELIMGKIINIRYHIVAATDNSYPYFCIEIHQQFYLACVCTLCSRLFYRVLPELIARAGNLKHVL